MILGFLEKKSDDYSLEVQYHFVKPEKNSIFSKKW